MTSVIQNELEVEELAKDESEVMKVDATVEEVVNSVLEAVVTLAKEPEKEDAIKEESCLAIGPHSSATKDEKWLNAMRMTLDELEAEYAPHPFPYEGADGFLHSADWVSFRLNSSSSLHPKLFWRAGRRIYWYIF